MVRIEVTLDQALAWICARYGVPTGDPVLSQERSWRRAADGPRPVIADGGRRSCGG
jgi:hypothetical protein